MRIAFPPPLSRSLLLSFVVALAAPTAAPADDPACSTAPDALRALCVSYCEELDCTADAPEDPDACTRLQRSYERRSGGDAPPCEVTL